ncbi:alpha-amylase family glycosyl hydrolase [Paraoerskovia sediminicola]|nr:alpha-amylase family glycosyl hydrolase [Paraoerskovia sediminicola]
MDTSSRDWADTAIWWHVYPLGFVGAQTTPGDPGARPVEHTLGRLTAWLDDLVALGCNGLLLGPVFASESHGYDTVDHRRVDPRLGDDADLDALVAACRERGVRVLLDGVFNHVGRGHPWWRAAVEAGPGSPEAARFRSGDGERVVDGVPVVPFEGHDALVTLDHANPEVVSEVADVMAHWLDRGIDGWRLDAAYAVDPEFWRATVGPLRERFPAAWFVGEMIHGDYVAYVEESGLDSVTEYELWAAVRGAISSLNLFELSWTLGRHDGFAERFLPQTFLGNHDVTRLASALDPRHVGHAVAILFFVAGAPSVYAGDERGLTGVKEERFGGDDAVRQEFPADPGEWPPSDIYRTHQEAIAFRRRNPWLARATIEVQDLTNTSAVLVASGPAGERAELALNLGDDVARGASGEIAPHAWRLRGPQEV